MTPSPGRSGAVEAEPAQEDDSRPDQTEKTQNKTKCDSNWNQMIRYIYLIDRCTIAQSIHDARVLPAPDLVGQKPAEEAGNAGNQRGKR